jgi:hypothetical protein
MKTAAWRITTHSRYGMSGTSGASLLACVASPTNAGRPPVLIEHPWQRATLSLVSVIGGIT